MCTPSLVLPCFAQSGKKKHTFKCKTNGIYTHALSKVIAHFKNNAKNKFLYRNTSQCQYERNPIHSILSGTFFATMEEVVVAFSSMHKNYSGKAEDDSYAQKLPET